MNKIIRVVLPAVMAALPIGMLCGTATAAPVAASSAPTVPAVVVASDPGALSTDILPGVRYTSNTQDHSTVIQTGIGTLVTQGGQFQVKDATGSQIAGTAAFATKPKAQEAVETPAAPAPAVHEQPVAPVESTGNVNAQADFDTAFGIFSNEVGVALSVGALGGGVVGGIGGCVLGAVTGGTIFIPTTGPLGIPAMAAGCVVGAGAGITIGAVVGGVAVGVPVGIASGAKMYNTLHAAGDI